MKVLVTDIYPGLNGKDMEKFYSLSLPFVVDLVKTTDLHASGWLRLTVKILPETTSNSGSFDNAKEYVIYAAKYKIAPNEIEEPESDDLVCDECGKAYEEMAHDNHCYYCCDHSFCGGCDEWKEGGICETCGYCSDGCCGCTWCEDCEKGHDQYMTWCEHCEKCGYYCVCATCREDECEYRGAMCEECGRCDDHCSCKMYREMLSKIPCQQDRQWCTLCADERRDFLQAVASFYVLEELIYQPYTNSPRHQKLRHDAIWMQKTLEQHLALFMRDYLVLSAFGEARHIPFIAKKALEKRIHCVVGVGRSRAYKMAHPFSVESLIEGMKRIFDQPEWGGGFGGKNWSNIVSCAGQYSRMKAHEFVDHAIDQVHNGGCAYSKPILIDYCGEIISLFNYLDYKREHSSIMFHGGDGFSRDWKLPVASEVFGLIRRARAMEFVSEGKIQPKGALFTYKNPVRWGKEDFLKRRLF